MKINRIVSALLACGLTATPVFASGIVQKLFPKNAAQRAEAEQKPKIALQKAGSEFTDFSGDWSGFCTYMGFRFPLSLALANTDKYLRIDGEEYGIGQLDTRTIAGSRMSIINHTAVAWDAGMTRLAFRNVGLNKGNEDEAYRASTSFDLGVSDFTLALEQETLTIRGYSMMMPDLEPDTEVVALDCALQRG